MLLLSRASDPRSPVRVTPSAARKSRAPKRARDTCIRIHHRALGAVREGMVSIQWIALVLSVVMRKNRPRSSAPAERASDIRGCPRCQAMSWRGAMKGTSCVEAFEATEPK